VTKRYLWVLGLTAVLGLSVTVAQDKKDGGAAPAKTEPAKTTPAPAAASEVELAWKFAKDKVLFQKLRTLTEQKMKVMNTNVDQKQEQEFVFSWKVEDIDASKIVLVQKIESVVMKITISGNEIKFDSTAKDAPDNPLASFFKPLIGSTFKLTLDPNTMKVVKVEGREEFVKRLSDANPQMKTLLSSILNDEQLKLMSEPAFTLVPDKGKKVKKDDKWQRTGTMKMGPIGSYAATYDYTYDAVEKKDNANLHKVLLKTTLKYTPPEAKDAAGLPFKINSGSLETKDASGTVWFDAENGRVAESQMTVKLSGKLNVTVSDQAADVDLDMTQTTYTSTHDKNPNDTAPATTPASGAPAGGAPTPPTKQ
jgi:hypothetical protein